MKQMKKLLSVLLAVLMVFSLMSTALAVNTDESLEGKVVILHSNDVHGGVAKPQEDSDEIKGLLGYARMAALRDEYVKQGAEVILADVGDFSQGSPYVSVSKGASAIEMMNAVGYDVVTLGNHEFDFGFDNLMANLEKGTFKVVCGDVIKDGKSILDGWTIIEKAGVKIGFVGLETPETYTKVNPGLIQGISFPQKEELYKCAQTLVDEVKAAGADVVVGLFHLGVDKESVGNRSVDVYENVTGIDFIIDGHAHRVMTPGDDGEFSKLPIQSTGTKFANIGVVVIDPAAKAVSASCLVSTKDLGENAEVKAKAEEIMKAVDDQYGAVFAKSEVELNGDKAPGNRNMETNLGDLVADSMVWSVLKDTDLKVPAENVVGVTNGGGIRAWIHEGDVSMQDVNTVLPFGNTVTVIYVTGAELLEALEASCFNVPDPTGGFPQVSGMSYTINLDKEFDPCDEVYPDSTYYGPKSIQRVTIDEINGFAFDEEATYAVVTNNFCSAGGDTYYAFKAASDQFDTSIPMDEALMNYIKDELGGVIGKDYAEPQGRIFIGTTEEIAKRDLDNEAAYLKDYIEAKKDAYTEDTYKAFEEACAAYDKAETNADRAKALDAMKDAVKALAFKPHAYKDVENGKWYSSAVTAVNALGLMNGTGNSLFEPMKDMTRAMVATVLYRLAGEPDVTDLKTTFTDLRAGSFYEKAVIWAFNAGVVNGVTDKTFEPDSPVTRQQMAAMMARYICGADALKVDDAQRAELRKALEKVYSDAAAVSNYAVAPVSICYDIGIMQGDKAGTFRPTGTLNRAECAKILENLYNSDIELLTAKDAPAEQEAPADQGAQAEVFFAPAA